MSTRQAVWPAELMDRRRRALELERRIRAAAVGRSGPAARELAALRAELAELPCPHWDVEPDDLGEGAWCCTHCRSTITPMWVAISDQEPSLRQAARQWSAHRHEAAEVR